MRHVKIDRCQQIVDNLRRLPRKMLQMHHNENITEFVLHELCSQNCFNLEKAAYFVDNPDFDCVKGIAGYAQNEVLTAEDIWQNPTDFSKKMASSSFNQQVKSLTTQSCKRCGKSEQEFAYNIANELGLTNVGFYSWDMKYDNHGLLICQKTSDDNSFDDIILDGLSLLGFCPIY